ncbi:MAG: amidophosphoribosyltransferase [Candidatus Omnitrophica bacterium]|nr:amidophosphoribosyltransferase [Candidatus Omnitrophota bacterium]MCF7894151.1 amidophosphoribosyltransferase [Candidatus Omnitrophota bacterium]
MSGIFGVISKNKRCMNQLFYLGDYHSHLGTQFGGVALSGRKMTRKIHNISSSQFKSKLLDEYSSLEGNKGIGAISYEEQPLYVKSRFGDFCLVINGWVNNWKPLSRELFSKNFSFSEISNSRINICELVSKLILQKGSLVKGIEYMYSKIEGSISLLILTKKGIYASRDKYGTSSLVVGKSKNGFAVVTETAAFPNLDFKIEKELLPGEVVFINKNGLQQKKKGVKKNLKICAFSWIYTGFPASCYEGVNTEKVRQNCGRCLALADKIKPDLAAGVPDSGTAHAIGYALGKSIPFCRPLVKYTPGYGRSYLPSSQSIRNLVAKMKLIPIKEVIKKKKIVLCEDSIVRGTQLKNYTLTKLWENKAKQVHVRVACPPLMFPCIFNYSTRTKKELVARRAIKAIEKKEIKDVSQYIDDKSPKYDKMVSWIAKDLGATSLKYQKIDDMVSAIGLPKDKLCLYCWTGKR